MAEFRSAFTPLFQALIHYRKASDRWNVSSYEPFLILFDRFCASNYPENKEMTQEMVDSWCRQREGEMNNSCRSRIYVVVSFIRYLRERGLTLIASPVVPRKEKRTYIPHAFTREELERFFHECDSLTPYVQTPEQRLRQITVPVFFRLLYSSGIRTNEARMLQMADVNLSDGVLDIRYSKGHNQHYIVLHDSMFRLMRTYDHAIRKLYPDRTYFFPARNGGFHTRSWVQKNFRQLWDKVNRSHATAYELRHHYAIENINQWVDYGFGFDDKILYLSKSMGHTTIESTRYYYSLVPGMSHILEKHTEDGFNALIPEVDDEDWE